MENQLASLVTERVLESLQEEERKIDAKLHTLESMDDDELERLREKRMLAMKKQVQQNHLWQQNGHGEYTELADQQEFFNATKRSKQLVVHFYSPTNKYCAILDRHLTDLAPRHLETKFCKINAEKAEYLVQKLGVWMIPTLALCKEQEVVHMVAGFGEFGGTENFSTQFVEYYLSEHKVLKYDGPVLETFTDDGKDSKLKGPKSSGIRQTTYYDSDLEEDD